LKYLNPFKKPPNELCKNLLKKNYLASFMKTPTDSIKDKIDSLLIDSDTDQSIVNIRNKYEIKRISNRNYYNQVNINFTPFFFKLSNP
jgi:hypothetical protein